MPKNIWYMLSGIALGFIAAVAVVLSLHTPTVNTADAANGKLVPPICRTQTPKPTPTPTKSKTPTPTPTPSKSSTPPPPPPPPTSTPPPGTWKFTSSAIDGQHSFGDFVVRNNVWNPIKGFTQTIQANSGADWQVTANGPKNNTAVVSYPDSQQTFTLPNDTDDPLTAIKSISSTFSEVMPQTGTDSEAAYDIWLNDYNTEVMIWNEVHGQVPAGTNTGNVTIGGVSYSLWVDSGGGPVSLVMNTQESAGTVDLLGVLNYLQGQKLIPANSGLSDVEYGFEICNTGGVSQTFALKNYSITSS
jgi:hypothetical protein